MKEQHRYRWTRRSFVKTIGAATFVGLVGAAFDRQSAAVFGGQTCGYGAGLYGGDTYLGTLDAALPAISVTKSGSDVTLSWNAGGAFTYEIWRSSQPFVPGDPGSIQIGTITGTDFTDPGALVAPEDRYYVARGIATCN